MNEQEYIIEVYHNGAVIKFPVPGKERYLKEKDFLNALLHDEFGPDFFPQPVPNPKCDFYYLGDDQFNRYLDYRSLLSRR